MQFLTDTKFSTGITDTKFTITFTHRSRYLHLVREYSCFDINFSVDANKTQVPVQCVVPVRYSPVPQGPTGTKFISTGSPISVPDPFGTGY
eukprot:SAG31_NODE_11978_length_980_cov_1.242906_2_plen_91_part_00